MNEEIQYTFIVPSRPVPYVRTTGRQKYVDPRYLRYRGYKEYFGLIAQQKISENKNYYCHRGFRVEVEARAYLKGNRRIDADNILKAYFDAGNKTLWDDDSQIKKATIEKFTVSFLEEECSKITVIKRR